MGGFALFGILLIVYIETGLLVGFFLPGDSLLFITGLMIAAEAIQVNGWPVPVWIMGPLVAVTAFAGDQTGYWIGRKAGHALFNRPNSRLFNHQNVVRTHAFFERYGSRAVILAHFVPVMRTFVPVAAGIGEMSYRKFVKYNIIGVISWGIGIMLLGYFLGQIEFVKHNVEYFTIFFVIVSTIPIALEAWRARKHQKHEEARAEREEAKPAE